MSINLETFAYDRIIEMLEDLIDTAEDDAIKDALETSLENLRGARDLYEESL